MKIIGIHKIVCLESKFDSTKKWWNCDFCGAICGRKYDEKFGGQGEETECKNPK